MAPKSSRSYPPPAAALPGGYTSGKDRSQAPPDTLGRELRRTRVGREDGVDGLATTALAFPRMVPTNSAAIRVVPARGGVSPRGRSRRRVQAGCRAGRAEVGGEVASGGDPG